MDLLHERDIRGELKNYACLLEQVRVILQSAITSNSMRSRAANDSACCLPASMPKEIALNRPFPDR